MGEKGRTSTQRLHNGERGSCEPAGAGGLAGALKQPNMDYSLDWQEALCDFQHTHTHEDTRGSGRRAATTMPMLRAVTSTRELDDAVPVLHEDVAHAPQPQPRVEALSCRRPARTKSSIACVPAACPNQIEYCVPAACPQIEY